MRFNDLSLEDIENITVTYDKAFKGGKDFTMRNAQVELSEHFDVSTRTIRSWANKLQLNVLAKNITNPHKIMVYDIETSRVEFKLWWTGKQYVSWRQAKSEPKIISISWKWLGEPKIYSVDWGVERDDSGLMETFLKEYNKADMVIGQNNDRFDNRWVNARAMKHNLDVNIFVKSFDLMKEAKRVFRMLSYSMEYEAKISGVTLKREHEGMHMWDMLEEGTPAEQREYLGKMLHYNAGDIITTEEMYFRFRKYFGHKVHFGVLSGGEKYSCPNCGGLNAERTNITSTPAGTIQHIMKCPDDEVSFKLNHTQYRKLTEFKEQNDG